MPNIERLEQLKRVVRDAPDDLWIMTDTVARTDCGTARCAMGWARVDPWFLANTPIEEMVYLHRTKKDGGEGDWFIKWHELGPFFGIPSNDADNLFGAGLVGGDEVEKSEVEQNIDRVMAGQETQCYQPIQDRYDAEGDA